MHWLSIAVSISSLIAAVMGEQVPLGVPGNEHKSTRRNMDDFKLKHGHGVFTPKDMLELPRPGAATPNPHGDLAFMVVSHYSFEKKRQASVYL